MCIRDRVNASSEPGRIAVNGMSYSGRNGANANSAIIVSVTPADYGSDEPLAGIGFQRRLEEKAFSAGCGKIPVERYGDFSDTATTGHIPTAVSYTHLDVYKRQPWREA